MQLAYDAENGEQVPYDLVDAGPADGKHQPLWCYRTLTGEFIRQRLGALGMLPSYLPAALAIEKMEGLNEWLLARGEQHVPNTVRDRADATLRVFLAEVLGEDSNFEFDESRFQSAWNALEAILIEGHSLTLLAAPIHGIEIESLEIRLDNNMMLVSAESIEAEALPGDIFRADSLGLPVVAVVIEAEDNSPEGLEQARIRLRKLLCALRLFGSASPALGGAARLQVERGPWQVMGLEGSGSARGVLAIETRQEHELESFCRLVANRWPRGGEIAWALRRHEFGCDRMHYLDGLSDHLLALRALLEPEGPMSGHLTDRLAALCAEPNDRARLAERAARAAGLERTIVAGLANRETQAEQLCIEMEMHLRALLKDVICQHLDSDLVTLADMILAQSAGIEQPVKKRRLGFGDGADPLAA